MTPSFLLPINAEVSPRMKQPKREGKMLPPGAAADANGQPTEDPHEVAALLPFGGHKGYGICLLNEIFGGLIGGSLKRRKKFQCFRFSSHPPRGSRW